MEKLRICFIVAVLGLFALAGCSADSEYEPPETSLEAPAPTVEIETSPKVHGGVLAEFARRGGGDCILTRAESSVDGVFHFEWESPRNASWTAGEVIGAVMSVLRGYDGYVGGLEIVRTYAGGSRRISINHADYSEFVEGRINDPAFIEKHQLEE